MPSILPGYEYDIFISYRQKDNRSDQWVTNFVQALREELDATFKEEISIYFDENPHDGLLETHDVDQSLNEKVKCLVFIPIVSLTYCDPKSFAWQKEFLSFRDFTNQDKYGLDIKLPSGNVAKRILPVRIHEIDEADKKLFENEIGGILRPIDFIYKEPGVNRPLRIEDDRNQNLANIDFRNQVNKVANATKEIILGLKSGGFSNIHHQSESTPLSQNKSKLNIKIIFASIAALLLISIGYFFVSKESMPVDEAGEKSIAVIPFKDISVAGDQQYFADGVMEDILTQLQKMPELRVISRTSVEKFRTTNLSASEIGEELEVGYLLEGSVRKAENQIMITAQLIKTESDRHVWADNFTSEYSAKGLFEIQRKIAASIVRELKLAISPREIEDITKPKTTNIQAYELYQKAWGYYFGGTKNENDLTISISRQVISSDPNYVDAYALLANAYAQAYRVYGQERSLVDSSELYARRGILLDSACSICYTALAKAAISEGNLDQSILFDQKAILLNPTNLISISNQESKLLRTGRWDLVLENMKYWIDGTYANLPKDRAKGIQAPSFMKLFNHLGIFDKAKLYGARTQDLNYLYDHSAFFSFEIGEEWFTLGDSLWFNNCMKIAIERSPQKEWILLAKLGNDWLQRDYGGIIENFETHKDEFINLIDANNRWDYLSLISMSYYNSGKKGKAISVLKDGLDGFIVKDKDFMIGRALEALYRGQTDESLNWIDKAIESGYLIDLDMDSRFEELRGNNAYQQLIRKQQNKREEVLALISTYHFPEPADLL